MKRLDSKSLFDIFDAGDEEVYQQHGVQDILDNSFVLFGMVIRGVDNFYLIDQMYANKYQNEYVEVRDSIKLKYFTGLMRYLVRIDDIPLDTVSMLQDEFGIDAIHYSLNELLQAFEQDEQYELCSVVAKYLHLFSIKQLVD
jgi:hypothetical protein